MDPPRDSQVVLNRRIAIVLFFAVFCISQEVSGYNRYTVQGGHSFVDPDIRPLGHERYRRDVTPENTTVVTVPTNTTTEDVNRTNKQPQNATSSTQAPVSVTTIPLLRNDTAKPTPAPKVSDPIYPDDAKFTEMFEDPEQWKAEHNITNSKNDTHNFYNSTWITDRVYFDQYWANISESGADTHPILSHSHRRATTVTLKFDFPYYGNLIRNITVATGGFLYTGDQIHNWLAATQYVAPLMANFDTTINNDSFVKMYNEEDRFTAFWENATVQEEPTKKFTFAVTLHKNGDIDFAYKDIPIPITNISDQNHPVKIGISDAYLNDRIFFLIRRKTIYEYHRVSFKKYEITNGTLLKLTALPTCLKYTSCDSCVHHDTDFECMWCEAIQKCSSGTDRNKQDWMTRNCDKPGNSVVNETQCPGFVADAHGDNGNTAYVTDGQNNHSTVVNTLRPKPDATTAGPTDSAGPQHAMVVKQAASTHSAIGGVVAAFVAITLVCSAAAWTLYAYKNPHTRSGQILIKYRPTQWRWRRGEARYTAATIHM